QQDEQLVEGAEWHVCGTTCRHLFGQPTLNLGGKIKVLPKRLRELLKEEDQKPVLERIGRGRFCDGEVVRASNLDGFAKILCTSERFDDLLSDQPRQQDELVLDQFLSDNRRQSLFL